MTAREVELSGGAPWGFRMHGGADLKQPLKISRVNPGRKASLSGIREGDVISSINGRPTNTMSNADAHAMLRCAGPVLKLGLNEDREMSPRRRSIGKGTELKRPSQLIAESQKATPQPPVYATIRPNNINNTRQSPTFPNSLPIQNSSPLKNPSENQEFHPTNPFYTTLPHSSNFKLPLPNGKSTFSELDRSRNYDFLQFNSDSKSFEQQSVFGPSSFPYNHSNDLNGHNYTSEAKPTASNTNNCSYETKSSDHDSKSLPKFNNPFDTKSKDYGKNPQSNGQHNDETQNKSDQDFERKEEITKRSTITEHKISEVEEIKTIKKFILNGSDSYYDEQDKFIGLNTKSKIPESKSVFSSRQSQYRDDKSCSPNTDHYVKFDSPTKNFELKDYRSMHNQSNEHDYSKDYKSFTSKSTDFTTHNDRKDYEYEYRLRKDSFLSPTERRNYNSSLYGQTEQKGHNAHTYFEKDEYIVHHDGNFAAKTPSPESATSKPLKSPSAGSAPGPKSPSSNTRESL